MDAGPGPAIWDAFYPKLYAAIFGKFKGLTDFVGTNSGSGSAFTAAASGTSTRRCGRPTGTSCTRSASVLRHAEAVRADRGLEGA